MPNAAPHHAPLAGPAKVHAPAAKVGPIKRRPSSAKRGYGRSWARVRAEVLRKNPVCRACRRAAATEVDHVLPRRRGGSDDPRNLMALCKSCHSRKTASRDGGLGSRHVGPGSIRARRRGQASG